MATTITTQQIMQTIIKKSKIPNQCIPFICVFIIAKTPTILLAGFVMGYYILFKHQYQQLPDENEKKLIKATSTPFVVNNSLEYDNELHYASINYNSATQEDLLDDMSNSSVDFENLMRFPPCPTTLPRLDTHFNFVSDDDNHHHLQQNNSIDWPAIHQELEYDKQRNSKFTSTATASTTITTHSKEQHPLYMLQSQNDVLTFSSSSSSEEDNDNDISSLLSLESIIRPSIIKQTTGSRRNINTPSSHDNAAAILLVDQLDQDLSMPPIITSFTSHINNMALLDDILLLPSPTPLPKPSLSSPGQLFKSKFQKAVKKMKKSNSNNGDNNRRSSTYSQDSFISSKEETKKASSLQIHSYFPNPSSPRLSASARINDHFKGRFNKLFKK
ncbi:hypothetical protein INT46_001932 [Mucor plumbeus]|uniref:Uncharacterized protein n=1 Tax=Mucor plumbeus TaxID=97098 RepID=A0A8H7UTW3_9FUNG|nr:hypothetical protein INT46_001932 [Mucor plumbeus]